MNREDVIWEAKDADGDVVELIAHHSGVYFLDAMRTRTGDVVTIQLSRTQLKDLIRRLSAL